jgi:hypothetical protein
VVHLPLGGWRGRGLPADVQAAHHVEDWISDIEDDERQRTRRVKQQFLPEITIYRNRPAGGVDTYQLLYDPAPLRGE